MAKNPPWNRDELILALDLYVRNDGRLPPREQIEDLSRTLLALAGPVSGTGATFRNANGVNMKLGNFQALDSRYTNDGKVGLKQGGQGDRSVWEEFSGAPTRLREVAKAILAGVVLAGTVADGRDELMAEASEGRLLTRLHTYRERNGSLRRKKIRSVLSSNGALRCEVCGFDFEAVYGERGRGFIEVHHLAPLHELVEARATKIDDLALVCANCHRMIHAKRPWLSISEIRALRTDLSP